MLFRTNKFYLISVSAVDYCRISTEIDGIIEKNTVDMNRIMCYNEYVIRCRISTVRMEEALYE